MDGNVRAADLVILSQYLAGNLNPDQPPFSAPVKAADINGQWGVSSEDFRLLSSQLTQ